jgi:hypothetical protein
VCGACFQKRFPSDSGCADVAFVVALLLLQMSAQSPSAKDKENGKTAPPSSNGANNDLLSWADLNDLGKEADKTAYGALAPCA